jgi:hypothetical protein
MVATRYISDGVDNWHLRKWPTLTHQLEGEDSEVASIQVRRTSRKKKKNYKKFGE